MKRPPPTHRDKIMAGLETAAALGRLPGRKPSVPDKAIRDAIPLGTVAGAKKTGLSVSTFIRRRRRIEGMPHDERTREQRLEAALLPFAKLADSLTVTAAAEAGNLLMVSDGSRKFRIPAQAFLDADAALKELFHH